MADSGASDANGSAVGVGVGAESVLGHVTHGWTVERWLQVDPTRTQRVARAICSTVLRGLYRSVAYGSEHVPATGAFLLCPNHNSWVDVFLQLERQQRVVRLMGKSEVFGMPLVGRFARAGGAFPVVRDAGDATARHIARLVLERGEPLVVYPEGTRKGHTDRLGRPRSGAALLALQTGSPVVAVATCGLRRPGERLYTGWPKATTVFGQPMFWPRTPDPTRQQVADVRDALWAYVLELYELASKLNAMPRRPRHVDVPPPP